MPVFIRGQVERQEFRVQAEKKRLETQEEIQGSGVSRGTRSGQLAWQAARLKRWPLDLAYEGHWHPR